MANWLYTHRRQIIIVCLLLILTALVGHLLADATRLSPHSAAIVDLHGNFLLAVVAAVIAPHLIALICFLASALCWYQIAPPTPPPLISVLD
jgi:hypothetical protein